MEQGAVTVMLAVGELVQDCVEYLLEGARICETKQDISQLRRMAKDQKPKPRSSVET
ncbi:hypothetical protein ACLOJK_030621 [Asimina triloba]